MLLTLLLYASLTAARVCPFLCARSDSLCGLVCADFLRLNQVEEYATSLEFAMSKLQEQNDHLQEQKHALESSLHFSRTSNASLFIPAPPVRRCRDTSSEQAKLQACQREAYSTKWALLFFSQLMAIYLLWTIGCLSIQGR
jgi:hypothetical protein